MKSQEQLFYEWKQKVSDLETCKNIIQNDLDVFIATISQEQVDEWIRIVNKNLKDLELLKDNIIDLLKDKGFKINN